MSSYKAILFLVGCIAALLLPSRIPAVLAQSDSVVSAIGGESRVFAAFLVAYESERQRLAAKGVRLTPAELVKRHYWIRCSLTEKGVVEVGFGPATSGSTGGGVSYTIDADLLKVNGSSFSR